MSALPTGTVTFLFTDIEGSTRLVQALGDGYRDLIDLHGAVIREAVAAEGGIQFGSEGDAVFAVFDDAARGVAAGVATQRALAAARWPADAEVRVRIGIHTGQGTLGGDNYIGLDVHRAARIAAAGHGGQVVLSGATRLLVEGALPEGVSLRDLGPHRLKDLAQPEDLYQLEIDGLAAEFPPLRTLSARPNNLPVQLTSFVGREGEIAAVGGMLDRARLVTLTGPGGAGKTRLALQVAAERLTRYADGAFFVDLAPVTDASLVASAVASSTGVREAPAQPLTATLADALRDKELLLVLDNFEQITDAAPLVADLLGAASRLSVLVTSRAVLHISGEHEYPVPPLRVPDPAHMPPLAALSRYEGVTLFVERARAARPEFAVTDDSWPAIGRIVARLDGLPLAIELAATKVKLLTPDQIVARLDDRLAFLAGGPRDLPARQRALRETIAWSYGLLPPGEQALLRRLAVFAGGWTLDAAEAVCRPDDIGLDTLDGLAGLLDQSLIRRDEGVHGGSRFMMLETIREYALEQLLASGERDELARRHAEHFTAVAEATEPELTKSPDAVERIDHDHDNFRSAVAWAIGSDDAELGMRLGYALWRFWQLRSHLSEGRMWFDRLLALPSAGARNAARAKGLTGAAGIAYWQNEYPTTETWYVEAESIYRDLGDHRGLAGALYNTGLMLSLRGDVEGSLDRIREGTALARDIGDLELELQFLSGEGYTAFMVDDFVTARRVLDEALAIAERTGNQFAIGSAHHVVAQVARLDGRLAEASEHYRNSIGIARALGDTVAVTEPLQGLAAVLVATGDADRGVRLLGANAAIRERAGGGPPPEWLRLGDPFSEARRLLGENRYRVAWEAGLMMSVDEAIADALGQPVSAPASQ
ncbi:MAG TPA: adenylate/guanylate cyclase domain-containing protein [Candidatus Limnocylindria bacterium]